MIAPKEDTASEPEALEAEAEEVIEAEDRNARRRSYR